MITLPMITLPRGLGMEMNKTKNLPLWEAPSYYPKTYHAQQLFLDFISPCGL